MFIGNSKFTRVCAIIAFTVSSFLFTFIIAFAYLFGQDKPSALGVVIVVLYDIFAIWFDMKHFPRKKKVTDFKKEVAADKNAENGDRV